MVFRVTNLSLAVPLIIFINVGVYLLWKIFGDETSSFMHNNFLVSYEALSEGRIWTTLTSVFSHNLLLHLFINMYVLKSFGPIVERLIGFNLFMRFYLIAGFVGSLGHVVTSYLVLHTPDLPALGASGAVAGIIILFALLFPKEKILLFGILPLPAIFGGLLAIGLDLWGLQAQSGGHGLPIGHGAHLGGALTGIIAYFILLKRLKRENSESKNRGANQVIEADFERL